MESPEIQERAIRDYIQRTAEREGEQWVIVGPVLEDIDQTGRTFARDGIRKAIQGVKDGDWNRIVCYNYARFGRNLTQAQLAIGEVEMAGGQVHSATEPFETESSIGTFNRSTLLGLAQLQSDQISDGWKAAQALRVSRGLPPGGGTRWGYRYHNPKTGRQCQEACAPGTCQTGYVPDETLGPVLAECYRRFNRGDGLLKITDWLNAQGYPTSRGAAWSVSTVSRMLDSGFGAGLIRHADPDDSSLYTWSQGSHRAVISNVEWDRYRALRNSKMATAPRARAPKWSLVGIAKCGRCGGGLNSVRNKPLERQGEPIKSRKLVRCITKAGQGASKCEGVYINETDVDAAAFAAVRAWASDIVATAADIRKSSPKRPKARDENAVEIARLEKQVEAVASQIDRLTDAYTQGAMTVQEYIERRQKTLAESETAKERIAELQAAKTARPEPQQALDLVNDWPDLPPEVKNRILASLLDAVVVYPGSIKDEVGKKKRLLGPRIRVIPKPGVTLAGQSLSEAGQVASADTDASRRGIKRDGLEEIAEQSAAPRRQGRPAHQPPRDALEQQDD